MDNLKNESEQITNLLLEKYQNLLVESGISIDVFTALDLVDKFTVIEDLQRN